MENYIIRRTTTGLILGEVEADSPEEAEEIFVATSTQYDIDDVFASEGSMW